MLSYFVLEKFVCFCFSFCFVCLLVVFFYPSVPLLWQFGDTYPLSDQFSFKRRWHSRSLWVVWLTTSLTSLIECWFLRSIWVVVRVITVCFVYWMFLFFFVFVQLENWHQNRPDIICGYHILDGTGDPMGERIRTKSRHLVCPIYPTSWISLSFRN